MKQKFLALVEEVKETQIVEALYEVSKAEQIYNLIQKFSSDKKDLCTRIKDWANEFKESDSEAIFKAGEKIENPMETVVVIYIINDSYVSEEEIFEDCEDIEEQTRDISNDFAKLVANVIGQHLICSIQPEDVFPD